MNADFLIIRPLDFFEVTCECESKKGKYHPITGHEGQRGSTSTALRFLEPRR